jgi:hypothetical protein
VINSLDAVTSSMGFTY